MKIHSVVNQTSHPSFSNTASLYRQIFSGNVYLQQGSMLNNNDVKKTIQDFGETLFSRFRKWIKNKVF